MKALDSSVYLGKTSAEVIGEVFYRSSKPGGKRRPCILVRCKCGSVREVLLFNLSKTAMCKPCLAESLRTIKPEDKGLYKVWSGMKTRCTNENEPAYADYGARGIIICAEWSESFLAFRDWARSSGYQKGLDIDRMDNDGPYAPGNCRWATRKVNCNNKRNNHLAVAFGETKTLAEWAEDSRCKVSYGTLWSRVKKGMPLERAMTAGLAVNQGFV